MVTIMEQKFSYVISKKHNAPTLLRKYNVILKNALNKKKFVFKFQKSIKLIELDIPRTFPESKWLKQETNQGKVKDLLRLFDLYSNIGYIQGMLFIIVPLLRLYENVEYLAFWSFIDITEMLRPLYFSLITGTCTKNKNIIHIIELWQACKRVTLDANSFDMLYLLLHYKFMTSLFLSLVGNNLNNVRLVLDYFMVYLGNSIKFKQRLHSLGLALLLSILPAHNIQKNIETISSCYLSNEALKIIIQTANECEFLFAKGSV